MYWQSVSGLNADELGWNSWTIFLKKVIFLKQWFFLSRKLSFLGKLLAGSANLHLVQKSNCCQHEHSISANNSQSTRECIPHGRRRPHQMVSFHSHLTSSQFLSTSVVMLKMLILLSITAGFLVNIHRWNQDNSQIKVFILVCLHVSALVTSVWCFEVLFWSWAVGGTF